MGERTHKCPYCTKLFFDENGRWMHAKTKHRDRKNAFLRPKEEEEDKSFADLWIEAQQNPEDKSLDWVRGMMQ